MGVGAPLPLGRRGLLEISRTRKHWAAASTGKLLPRGRTGSQDDRGCGNPVSSGNVPGQQSMLVQKQTGQQGAERGSQPAQPAFCLHTLKLRKGEASAQLEWAI